MTIFRLLVNVIDDSKVKTADKSIPALALNNA